jgi:hypothetical protein
MPDAAGRDAAVLSDGQNDCHRAMVSDLVCLIGHVHASTKLVELDMTGEALPGDPEVATNIVVLDDVTPRYVRAQATLNSCNAGLGIALHRIPGHRNTKEMASPNPAASGWSDGSHLKQRNHATCPMAGREPFRRPSGIPDPSPTAFSCSFPSETARRSPRH